MQAHREGRGKGSSEQQAVKSKLAELRSKFNALMVRLSGLIRGFGWRPYDFASCIGGHAAVMRRWGTGA